MFVQPEVPCPHGRAAQFEEPAALEDTIDDRLRRSGSCSTRPALLEPCSSRLAIVCRARWAECGGGALAARLEPVLPSALMGENVAVTRDGPIVTVTLNRPEHRNSLSDPMLAELGAAFAELRDDVTSRVVIVTGAPPVFSAGAHAPIKSSMSETERRAAFSGRKSQFRRLFERANTVLENLEQTTIAMINGHAVGGGWGLTLACDFRIAAAEAQLWIPEVDLGVPLGVASTTRFVRLVGPARAKEIIMTGRRYP